jgi:biopolymer transport protein ExbB/TolQ
MNINTLEFSSIIFIYLLIYAAIYGIFVAVYRFMIKGEALPLGKAVAATVVFGLIAAVPHLIFSRGFSIDINQITAYIIYIAATFLTLYLPKNK